jgi:hypothetical protein
MPVTADFSPRPPIIIPAGSRIEPDHLHSKWIATQTMNQVLALAEEVRQWDGTPADNWEQVDQVMLKSQEYRPGFWKRLAGSQERIDARAEFDGQRPVALEATIYPGNRGPDSYLARQFSLRRLPDGSTRYSATGSVHEGLLTTEVGMSKTSTYWSDSRYYEVESTVVIERPEGTLVVDLDSQSGTYY